MGFSGRAGELDDTAGLGERSHGGLGDSSRVLTCLRIGPAVLPRRTGRRRLR